MAALVQPLPHVGQVAIDALGESYHNLPDASAFG
jgi:hypothetical protein